MSHLDPIRQSERIQKRKTTIIESESNKHLRKEENPLGQELSTATTQTQSKISDPQKQNNPPDPDPNQNNNEDDNNDGENNRRNRGGPGGGPGPSGGGGPGGGGQGPGGPGSNRNQNENSTICHTKQLLGDDFQEYHDKILKNGLKEWNYTYDTNIIKHMFKVYLSLKKTKLPIFNDFIHTGFTKMELDYSNIALGILHEKMIGNIPDGLSAMKYLFMGYFKDIIPTENKIDPTEIISKFTLKEIYTTFGIANDPSMSEDDFSHKNIETKIAIIMTLLNGKDLYFSSNEDFLEKFVIGGSLFFVSLAGKEPTQRTLSLIRAISGFTNEIRLNASDLATWSTIRNLPMAIKETIAQKLEENTPDDDDDSFYINPIFKILNSRLATAGLTALKTIAEAIDGHPDFGWTTIFKMYPLEHSNFLEAIHSSKNIKYPILKSKHLENFGARKYQNLFIISAHLLNEFTATATIMKHGFIKNHEPTHQVKQEIANYRRGRSVVSQPIDRLTYDKIKDFLDKTPNADDRDRAYNNAVQEHAAWRQRLEEHLENRIGGLH